MSKTSSRRAFLKDGSLLVAGAWAAPWLNVGYIDETAIADTANGKVRGTIVDGVRVFKGISYGGPTSGRNRFMPPVKPASWTGARDALAFGPTAPQTTDNSGTTAAGSPAQQSEDCLVLNVFTPGLPGMPGMNTGRNGP
jgi:carboxylesterase type B